jgi:hypothetical protein
MSRSFRRVTAIAAVVGLVYYSIYVILIGSFDEQNRSGLHDQARVFRAIWIIAIGIGFLYLYRSGRLVSLSRVLKRPRRSSQTSRRSEFPQYLGMSTRYPREYCPYYRAGTCRFRAMTGRDTSAGPEQCSLRQGSYTECAVWAINPR